MGELLVRNVDDDLIRRLKERAAARGRSAEAEHRIILQQALLADSAQGCGVVVPQAATRPTAPS